MFDFVPKRPIPQEQDSAIRLTVWTLMNEAYQIRCVDPGTLVLSGPPDHDPQIENDQFVLWRTGTFWRPPRNHQDLNSGLS
ncbi:hypothetical protein ACVWW6_003642 [Bradyrhizobium sp. USDA 3311]